VKRNWRRRPRSWASGQKELRLQRSSSTSSRARPREQSALLTSRGLSWVSDFSAHKILLLTANSPTQEQTDVVLDPLAKTIVIHPGSTWLRIGRASDAFPLAIPNLIARKSRSFVPSAASKGKQREEPVAPVANPLASTFGNLPPLPTDGDGDHAMTVAGDEEDDEDEEEEPPVDPAVPVDPLSAKISSIRGDLRARMRAFKLRGQGNGNSQASAFNATVVPDATADYNDPGEIEWTEAEGPNAKNVYVGMKVRRRSRSEVKEARERLTMVCT
jgi:actin-related protein 8